MNKNSKAVYAGTFDMPTLGHFQMIKKAASLFGHIDVVVAINPKKTPWFSVEERVNMLKEMIKEIKLLDCSIEVVTLPKEIYLATFALNRGAKFLIRGIRDIWDFNYENNIYHANRRIQPSIETIYLMPDQDCSMVSSSWVKSLVGCGNWTNVIASHVPECVLLKLVDHYMEERFMSLAERLKFEDNNKIEMWHDIKEQYKPFNVYNAYHTLKHILKCLEVLDEYFHEPILNPKSKDNIELALWFHDIIQNSEEKSANLLNFHVPFFCAYNPVIKLIMATKHTGDTDTYEHLSAEEKIIASIDLFILGRNKEEYDCYVNSVYAEYFFNSGKTLHEFKKMWQQGRPTFLKKMLRRKVIYPWEHFEDMFGKQARENMTSELAENE